MPAPLIGAAALAALRAAAIRQAGKKGGEKIGQKVGQRVAESMKAPKVSSKGKPFNKKVEGPSKTTSKSGGVSTTPNAKRVSGTTAKPTRNQVAGRQKAANTKRNKAITKSADTARRESTPIVGKARIKGQAEGATGGAALTGLTAYAYGKKKDSQKKKK
jgi:hypothetical protein